MGTDACDGGVERGGDGDVRRSDDRRCGKDTGGGVRVPGCERPEVSVRAARAQGWIIGGNGEASDGSGDRGG